MKIRIINGPNLNLLGKREPNVYGNISFEDYFQSLKKQFPEVEFEYFQSNVEGELINKIQQWGFDDGGIIINAGGYTHTSVAIGDAIAAIKTPCIEVHVSNILGREEFRHHSFLSKHCIGIIAGLGLHAYDLAVIAFLKRN